MATPVLTPISGICAGHTVRPDTRAATQTCSAPYWTRPVRSHRPRLSYETGMALIPDDACFGRSLDFLDEVTN